jgi:hypothetical protein
MYFTGVQDDPALPVDDMLLPVPVKNEGDLKRGAKHPHRLLVHLQATG